MSIKRPRRTLLIAVAVAVVLVAGVVTVVSLIRPGSAASPKEAAEAVMVAVADKDTDALRAALCPVARSKAVHPAPVALFLGAPAMVQVWDGPMKFDRWSVTDTIEGSGEEERYFVSLDVTMVSPSGEKRPTVVNLVPFVRDDDSWYYCPSG